MTSGGGFITDGDAPTAQLKVTLADQVKTGEEKKNNLHPGKGLELFGNLAVSVLFHLELFLCSFFE
jgi:hypothetical protein